MIIESIYNYLSITIESMYSFNYIFINNKSNYHLENHISESELEKNVLKSLISLLHDHLG